MYSLDRDISWLSLILLWVSLAFSQIFGSCWPLVRHTPTQAETSCDQVWYYFGSAWYLVRSLGQADLWSDVLPGQRHLMAKFDTALGQLDIWSDLWVMLTFGETYPHPGRDILWPSVILLWVSLIFGQIFGSGWPLVRCAPWAETSHGQVWYCFGSAWHLVRSLGHADLWWDIPPTQAETSCDQVWYYFGSAWYLVRSLGQADLWSDVLPGQRHLMAKFDTALGQLDIWSDLWVMLTFGETYLPPRQRHLVTKCDTTLGQLDIWSDLWVMLTFGETYPPTQTETSCDQVWYYFGSAWYLVRSLGQADLWSDVLPGQRHLMAKFDTALGQLDIWSDLWVMLTFGETYLPPRQRHLVTKCDTTLGQLDIWSDLWVRLTFGQMYLPLAETSHGQVWYCFGSAWHLVRSLGHADLWSDVPPSRDISFYL